MFKGTLHITKMQTINPSREENLLVPMLPIIPLKSQNLILAGL
jgi:hypothetical protein